MKISFTSRILKKRNTQTFDCSLPMKIMKLVMKKPIQTHVIIGTFWGVEHLTLRSSQVQPVISFCKSFFYLAFGRSKDSVGFFLSFCNAASWTAGNQSKWNVEKGPPKKSLWDLGQTNWLGWTVLSIYPIYANIIVNFLLSFPIGMEFDILWSHFGRISSLMDSHKT